MRWIDSRGQAVTELALLAPLFAGLLVLLGLWARLSLTRLALIHLTRDTAILLAHDADHWDASLSEQQDQARDLAKHYALLDPARVNLEMEGLPLPGGSAAGNATLATLIVGKKIRLRYRLRPGGILGRAFPRGLELQEWGAVQGDPWQNPALSVLKAFTGG